MPVSGILVVLLARESRHYRAIAIVVDLAYLAECDAGRGVDGSVEGYAVLAPVLDDRDVCRGRACYAEPGVDDWVHGKGDLLSLTP